MRVDFVQCDSESRPLIVYEYQGSGHSNPEEARKDSFKKIIVEAVGLKLTEIPSRVFEEPEIKR
jgi:hypothetical protein